MRFIFLAVLSSFMIVVGCSSRQEAVSSRPLPSVSAPLSPYKTPTAIASIRATEWLNRCISGNWDWAQFGDRPEDAPTNPVVRFGIVQLIRKFLDPYGAVKAMQYVNKRSLVTNEGHDRTLYTYRLTLEHGILTYEFGLDADGHVGGVQFGTGARSVNFSR
jgi:hypothetical protein